MIGLLSQQVLGMAGTICIVKDCFVVNHGNRIWSASGIASGIKLSIFVHVHPGIELDRASEREAWIDICALPMQVGIQSRPGTVDTKV